ncbi:hypothetical protein AA103196_2472 [Ameyamaea chiangmaiensis NBRC 103196]|uniref:NERD domain-containing protein n=1 Tax=Ameyamaea chiangmaiensis TaxID=442969 RepID=A0A850P9E0_9PROT|nr:nuclease-related domain-containing protein [Ameyamaea chiangmaiensis]MBS4075725.1 NERD domain-containing protein [Ameyamaea chiangmaiensis]NVN41225.1 NERD domain-containing protein [Ameyamaea chiangmaiensis]GBQ70377.1 hypothetical protein AA103196_2472 [Ameyamaea chiangmaiensis NBRC 103196]
MRDIVILVVCGVVATAVRIVWRAWTGAAAPRSRPAFRPERPAPKPEPAPEREPEPEAGPLADLSDDAPPSGAASTRVADGLDVESAAAKGQDGERRVAMLLRRLNRPVLNDVILSDSQGLTQVDHIVKMPWGLVVIETKNYGGFVTGTPDPGVWKQSFRHYGSDRYYLFQNPLRQNTRHVSAVREICRLPEHVVPLVVFAGKARTSPRIHARIVRIAWLVTWFGQRPELPFISYQRLDDAWDSLKINANANSHRREEHLAALRARA